MFLIGTVRSEEWKRHMHETFAASEDAYILTILTLFSTPLKL